MRYSGIVRAVAAVVLGTVGAAHAGPAELAFVSIRSGDPQIFVRETGGQVRALTEGRALHAQPALSASGRLAYVARDGVATRVYVTDEQGRGAVPLTSELRFESSPAWSPDGRTVALFARGLDDGMRVDLVIVDVATRQSRVLASIRGDMGPTAPSWSRDGKRIAYVAGEGRRTHIFVAESDGSGTRNVSAKFAPRGGAYPEISPDGRQVAWIADQQGRTPVVVTDLASGQTRELTPESLAACETPRWSPDGSRIAFASLRDTFGAGRNEIFVMNVDGSGMRNVTQHEAEDFNPRWAADGRTLYYSSLRTGTSLIFEVDLDSGSSRPVSVHASHDMDHVTRPIALSQAAGASTPQ